MTNEEVKALVDDMFHKGIEASLTAEVLAQLGITPEQFKEATAGWGEDED